MERPPARKSRAGLLLLCNGQPWPSCTAGARLPPAQGPSPAPSPASHLCAPWCTSASPAQPLWASLLAASQALLLRLPGGFCRPHLIMSPLLETFACLPVVAWVKPESLTTTSQACRLTWPPPAPVPCHLVHFRPQSDPSALQEGVPQLLDRPSLHCGRHPRPLNM